MFKKFVTALRQDFIDLELGVAANITARVIERPGLWMSNQQTDLLIGDIRSIAAKTVQNETLDYGILTGASDRLKKSVLTILYDNESGQPVAFNALVTMDVDLHGSKTEVVHLGLVMVDPNVRSKGFSWALYGLTCLLLFARGQLRSMWLSNVTQVPAIIGMVSESFSDVYPRPAREARRSFEHLLLARQIMKDHRGAFGVGDDAEFDEERFVIMNAYTGGSDNLKKSFDEAQKHRDEKFNVFCNEQLNYTRGDDVLQLGRLDIQAARGFLVKNVPRRSLLAVAATLAAISLRRLVLPMVYWFSTDRPWGILRPVQSR